MSPLPILRRCHSCLSLDTQSLGAQPQPVQSYADALARIETLKPADPHILNPACTWQLLTHGQKMSRAVVFLHGYTNCSKQFLKLGQQFYALGYNVLIPTLPYQGLADRMTTAQAKLKAETLVRFTDGLIDAAQGLGDQVTLAGLSAGGTLAAWAAQYRHDLHLAVLIAPVFGYRPIPVPLTMLTAKLFLMLPNFYRWWDPVLKAEDGIEHVYPRYSTHALAQFVRIGLAVRTAARQQPPAVRSILIVTIERDAIPNPRLIEQITRRWRLQGSDLRRYEFPASLHLNHDCIDPDQPDQRIDVVYPQLIRLMTGSEALDG
jgi:pimeloyl-ACP methyl ester carboxylesterase